MRVSAVPWSSSLVLVKTPFEHEALCIPLTRSKQLSKVSGTTSMFTDFDSGLFEMYTYVTVYTYSQTNCFGEKTITLPC